MAATNLEIPNEFEEWPHGARSFTLAEANTAKDLRREINSLAGLSSDDVTHDKAGQFTKEQLATLVMALGGPNGGET
ncbi:hypothetical protein [Haloarcula amylovorans]|uniref:hypothetical protein n=1 Tax=Haloarcula amylovorans TaxID=2562280 RepID=UPI0010765CB5|nr:hypothetical protein [Halomicroarcula amylolytica]